MFARFLDSLIRAKQVFDCEKLVIVSDDFHVNRALFIADRVGLDAIAYRSQPVKLEISGGTRVREYFARVKAVLDLYLLGAETSGPGLALDPDPPATQVR